MAYDREECEKYRNYLESLSNQRAAAKARGEYLRFRPLDPPPGYSEYLKDEERSLNGLPPKKGFLDEYRNKLIFFGIVVAVLVALYYLLSPYQTCVRGLVECEGISKAQATYHCSGRVNSW